MPKKTYSESMQTKNSILIAAQKVFANKGFNKASLTDIAREANVTRGAIYWHYENKIALLASLLEEEARKLNLVSTLSSAAHENQTDPLGQLKQWALAHFNEDSKSFFNSSVMVIFESIIHSDISIEAREQLEELINLRFLSIEDALRNAVSLQQLPSDCDVELASVYIQATMFGLIMQMRQDNMKHSASYYKCIIECMFNHLGEIKRKNNPY